MLGHPLPRLLGAVWIITLDYDVIAVCMTHAVTLYVRMTVYISLLTHQKHHFCVLPQVQTQDQGHTHTEGSSRVYVQAVAALTQGVLQAVTQGRRSNWVLCHVALAYFSCRLVYHPYRLAPRVPIVSVVSYLVGLQAFLSPVLIALSLFLSVYAYVLCLDPSATPPDIVFTSSSLSYVTCFTH